jgi:hypothetical protein
MSGSIINAVAVLNRPPMQTAHFIIYFNPQGFSFAFPFTFKHCLVNIFLDIRSIFSTKLHI